MEDISLITWIVTIIIYTIDTAVRIWLLIHVPKNRKPTAATAWLLLIFMIPFIGAIIFFIIGNTKLSKTRRLKQGYVTKTLAAYSAEIEKLGLMGDVTGEYKNTAKLAASLTGLVPSSGNNIKLLTDYDGIIKDIAIQIEKSQKYIYLEFYILAMDKATERIFTALEEAQARGVEVYVLFDAWGSRKFPDYKQMKQRLTRAGINWRRILPFSLTPKNYNRPDLRNHRKIVVVDDTVAYIGSLNMIDKAYHRKDTISYIELAARIEGPAVGMLASVFASDWYSETDEILTHILKNPLPIKKGDSTVQVISSGPGYSYRNNLKTFVSLMYEAKESIAITNPYLVPDESLLAALTAAATRGVKVSILNSEAMDQWLVGHAQRSYYTELLEAGVDIYLYKKPQLVHEKHFSIDKNVAVIGSSNLDIRSFELNLECVVVAYDPKVATKLARRHQFLIENSKKVSLKQWKKRSGWQNFLDSIARLTSALQ